VKILLVTKCGAMRVVEANDCVSYQIPFPDGTWRVFSWDGGMDQGRRIFCESENCRISRKGRLKRWERP